MLQESADTPVDANIVGKSRDAWPQTTNSTYPDVDLHAFPTSGIESVDDLRIDECVALDPDLRRPAQSPIVDFISDTAQKCVLECDRRNRHLLESVRLGVASDEIKYARDISPNRRIRGEKRNVRVNLGGHGMIIASA